MRKEGIAVTCFSHPLLGLAAAHACQPLWPLLLLQSLVAQDVGGMWRWHRRLLLLAGSCYIYIVGGRNLGGSKTWPSTPVQSRRSKGAEECSKTSEEAEARCGDARSLHATPGAPPWQQVFRFAHSAPSRLAYAGQVLHQALHSAITQRVHAHCPCV